ncbi:MAG: hypothetical protein C0601_04700 [Candidatus Muiribacterium halophilum]|uniref:4Fe-4S ferredoxin-type domain-containing protein n=1 Tax=Muiribacterium halophilum TaxID=2053465 RepID=A0A2N5ZHY7_MUIH1|nr:MAG: hypothetical protein C0601_04700 [Candidatus Muirbacterium halophilum]
MLVNIDVKKCINCGKCAEICPVEAISDNGESYQIDNSICIYCLACERECPQEAILVEYDKKFDASLHSAKNKNRSNNDVLTEKKELAKVLRFIVEETIAPFLEKAFLLFIDGAERFFKDKKYR